jgi:hypothetical protein
VLEVESRCEKTTRRQGKEERGHDVAAPAVERRRSHRLAPWGGQEAAPAFDLYMRGVPPTGQGRWKWQRKKVRAEARREGLAMHAGRGER